MSNIDGKWNVEAATPMGPMKAIIDVKAEGDLVTGTFTNPEGDVIPWEEGSVDGDTFKLMTHVVRPMPAKLTADLTVDGDTVSGKLKLGIFPGFVTTGNREV